MQYLKTYTSEFASAQGEKLVEIAFFLRNRKRWNLAVSLFRVVGTQIRCQVFKRAVLSRFLKTKKTMNMDYSVKM